jgi:hypothetical protein
MGGSNEEFIDLFQEDINGVHVIYDHQYLLLDDSTSIYKCAKGWIILSPESIKDRSGDRKDCLLKSYIYDADDTEYKTISKKILKANNFILPEIAKAFGIEAATYGRFKIDKENDSELRREENIAYYDNRQPVYRIKPDTEYILTPSFLNNDEEFKAFGDIIPNDKDNNFWSLLLRILNIVSDSTNIYFIIKTLICILIKIIIY